MLISFRLPNYQGFICFFEIVKIFHSYCLVSISLYVSKLHSLCLPANARVIWRLLPHFIIYLFIFSSQSTNKEAPTLMVLQLELSSTGLNTNTPPPPPDNSKALWPEQVHSIVVGSHYSKHKHSITAFAEIILMWVFSQCHCAFNLSWYGSLVLLLFWATNLKYLVLTS